MSSRCLTKRCPKSRRWTSTRLGSARTAGHYVRGPARPTRGLARRRHPRRRAGHARHARVLDRSGGAPYHKAFFASGNRFVFFCAGGWRSALAAKAAQDMGLTPVCHIKGGFGAWAKAGAPIEKVVPKPRSCSFAQGTTPQTMRAPPPPSGAGWSAWLSPPAWTISERPLRSASFSRGPSTGWFAMPSAPT